MHDYTIRTACPQPNVDYSYRHSMTGHGHYQEDPRHKEEFRPKSIEIIEMPK